MTTRMLYLTMRYAGLSMFRYLHALDRQRGIRLAPDVWATAIRTNTPPPSLFP